MAMNPQRDGHWSHKCVTFLFKPYAAITIPVLFGILDIAVLKSQ